MTAREIFDAARERELEIRKMQERVDSLCELAQSCGSNGPKVSGGSIDDGSGKLAALLDENTKLQFKIFGLEQMQGTAWTLTDCVRADMGDCYANILNDYYLCAQAWTKISDTYGVTVRTAQTWRDVALDWIDSAILR